MRSYISHCMTLVLLALPLAAADHPSAVIEKPDSNGKEYPSYREHHHHPGKGAGFRQALSQLNLTEQQKKDIQALRTKHHPSLSAKRSQMQEAEKAFREAVRNKKSSEAELRALNQKASDAHFAIVMEKRAMFEALQQLLTAEQKVDLEKKLHALRENPWSAPAPNGQEGARQGAWRGLPIPSEK